VAPPKASKALSLAREIRERIPDAPVISDVDSERVCLDWILGRSLDAEYESATD